MAQGAVDMTGAALGWTSRSLSSKRLLEALAAKKDDGDGARAGHDEADSSLLSTWQAQKLGRGREARCVASRQAVDPSSMQHVVASSQEALADNGFGSLVCTAGKECKACEICERSESP